MDAFQWLYSNCVKNYLTNSRNIFDSDRDRHFKPKAEGMIGNNKCGDQMMLMLKIQNDIIPEVRWETYRCASAIPSTFMLSGTVSVMSIRGASHIKPSDIASCPGGLSEAKGLLHEFVHIYS